LVELISAESPPWRPRDRRRPNEQDAQPLLVVALVAQGGSAIRTPVGGALSVGCCRRRGNSGHDRDRSYTFLFAAFSMAPAISGSTSMASPARVRLVIAGRRQRFMAPQPRSPMRQRGGQSLGLPNNRANMHRPSIGGCGVDMFTPQKSLKTRRTHRSLEISVVSGHGELPARGAVIRLDQEFGPRVCG